MSLELGGICWSCGNRLSHLEYGRQDSCSKCGRDTRACKGCVFYERSYNNECRESQADRVVDKEKANFCDYFKPRGAVPVASSSSVGGVIDPNADQTRVKNAAEALFKKK